jgi:hypothetical protein
MGSGISNNNNGEHTMSATHKQNRSINKRARMHRDGTVGINDRSLLASYRLMAESIRALSDPTFSQALIDAACEQDFDNNPATPEGVRDAVADVAELEASLRRTRKARRKGR